MKKISINLNEEEYKCLERIIRSAKKRTGFRTSVSDVIRALVIRESRKIPRK